jgi:hypothetical protein
VSQDAPGDRPPPEGDYRLVLPPPVALLLGLVVAAFLAATAYVSHLPAMHHDLAFDLAEGLVVGGLVGGISGTRGLALRERRERPAPGGSRRRPPRPRR